VLFRSDELESAVARGYALDDEESGPGVKCVGVPIFGAGGSVIFAISVTSIPTHLDGERVQAVALALRAAARDASAAFGGSVVEGQPFKARELEPQRRLHAAERLPYSQVAGGGDEG
jgi:hypothetical protein